jgi:GrpB-like predicted nucleotidyltransferase (UPF0157 family)
MLHEIVVVEYDPKSPKVFEALRAPIASALGDLAAAIEHIGSTAVPGLAGKPVIDIDVLLASTNGLREAVERLALLGYAHQGNLGIAGREVFGQPPGQPAHHLYACAFDGREYRRHIAFRDYLRAHPESARAYGELKQRLAALYSYDRDRYGIGKGEFVNETLRHAMPSTIG